MMLTYREKLTTTLVHDDIAHIHEWNADGTMIASWVYDVLMYGHVGYDSLTVEELIDEFRARGLDIPEDNG
jgi:hypothetical protein